MRVILGFLVFLTPLAAQDLATAIRKVTDTADYKHGRWGILVADSKTGNTVYARNAETMFAPASVTKIFSCAAAMAALGADHRFETPVYAIGVVKEGTLKGDLVLVASGDLTFGGRIGKDGKTAWTNEDHIYTGGYSTETQLTDTNPVAAFEELARQVKAAGITKVTGDVLVDDRLFEISEGSGSGPKIVSPMIANDNLIDLIIAPGEKAGDPAKFTLRPDTAYLRTDFDVKTVAKGELTHFSSNDGDVFSLRGQIAEGAKPRVAIVPVSSPRDFARTLLIEALRRVGVTVTAALIRHPATSELPKSGGYDAHQQVAVFKSAPLIEALEVTLKVSHNLYASTLPHLVGVRKKAGTSLAAGLGAQGKVLKDLGADVNALSFGGGAGGANADHVTPRATVDLLRALQKRDDWKQFKEALPILGVDGTLAKVVDEKSPAKGKVYAKTGTLYWADLLNGRSYLTSKALAGVMTTKNGTELTIAMFVNDVPLASGVRTTREGKALGKLCEIIYENGP